MPLLFLAAWTIYLILHFNANAMTIENYHDTGRHIEMSKPVKDYICSKVDCPEHITVDRFKITDNKFASVKISSKWRF